MTRFFPAALLALAAAPAAPAAAPYEMDYGPFLAATFQTPNGQPVYKGVAVRFDLGSKEVPEGPKAAGGFANAKSDDELLKNSRVDCGGYKLNVPDGTYKVTLWFCEPRDPGKGKPARTTDILIQGKKVKEKVELALNEKVELVFDKIDVKGGFDLELTNKASLAALAVEGDKASRKINCGGPAVKDFAADWPNGYAISKDPGAAGVLFDTETLRVAAAWTGGFVKLQGVVFDGGHGTNPSLVGKPIVETSTPPGWAKGTDLKDPREIPHGPLPRDWAKYKGLHRTDKGIVFEYAVGTATVRELPSVETIEGQPVLVRGSRPSAPSSR